MNSSHPNFTFKNLDLHEMFKTKDKQHGFLPSLTINNKLNFTLSAVFKST